MMHVRFPAGPRQHLDLERHGAQEVTHPVRALLDIEALHQLRILSRNPHRAAPRVAVMAEVRLGPELLVILHIDRLIAVERNQRRGSDVDGVGSQRDCLGRVHAVANAAGDDQLHHAVQPALFKRRPGLADRRQRRNAGVLLQDRRRRSGASFHSVHHDHVRARFGRQLHVVEDTARAHLDEDRDLPVGRFANFLDLDDHVVRPEKIRMPRRAALVDSDRQVALFGDRARDFGAQQQPPGSGLGALSDRQLDRVGHAHVMHVDAVAGRQDLVDQRAAVLPLGHQHAAVAGGVRGSGRRRAFRQRHFRVVRQRAPAHPGDHDGNGQLERLARKPRSQHGPGRAFLAIAFERNARQRAGQKRQIVECGPATLAQRAVAADAVEPRFGLGLDVVDDARRKRPTRLQDPL